MTSASASASSAGVVSGGPCRRSCWNRAWQVTSSIEAGTPAQTWRGLRGRPGQGGVDAETEDLHTAAGRPAQRIRGQAEVGQPGLVSHGESLRSLGDDLRTVRRVEGAVGEQVVERVAGHPLHDYVGMVPVVLYIEHLRQARVGEPARRARGSDHLADAREARRERQDSDGPRQRLVARHPRRPAAARVDSILEPVAAAEPGARFRNKGAHASEVKSGAGPRPSFRAPVGVSDMEYGTMVLDTMLS